MHTPTEPLCVKRDGDRLVIDLALRDAEALQNHLRRAAVGTTIRLQEPWSKEARLEVWPGSEEAAVRKALDGWHR